MRAPPPPTHTPRALLLLLLLLLQNDSLATLLARLEGILGPVPEWMVQQGRYANRFYTRRWGAAEPQSALRLYKGRGCVCVEGL